MPLLRMPRRHEHRAVLEQIGTFAARRAPASLTGRSLLLLADMVLFNAVFYQMLRALLLQPLGYVSTAATVAWVLLFALVFAGLQALQPHRGLRTWLGVGVQVLGIVAFCVTVSRLAAMKTVDKGGDFSWLRVEVIKVPLWLGMFAKACPGVTTSIVLVALLSAWRMLAAPRSQWIRAVPLVALVALWLNVHGIFAFFPNEAGKPGLYTVLFCGPLAGFALLFGAGALTPAMRAFPLVLHMSLIGLNYIGLAPVHALSPPFASAPAADHGQVRPNTAGVARIHPVGGAPLEAPLAFLRKLVLSPERAYVSFGPTCGIYGIDRQSGGSKQLDVRGLIRDMSLSPDGRSLWGSNWMTGDFIAVDPATLQRTCVADMFQYGLATPWDFIVEPASDRVYLSNVTQPIVAELRVQMDGSACKVTVERSIDFHKVGYTPFTDGAFGLHVDRARDRLYVIVGMLEGRFEMGLVEVQLSTFRILRDLRLAAGATLVPIRGRNAALLPSYYDDLIYEVDLGTLKVTRTLHAAPTIIAIEQDDKRGLYYATSRTTGELLVIDANRFEVLRRYSVGAKPEALGFDAAADQLFVGGSKGIFRIDLKPFLASP